MWLKMGGGEVWPVRDRRRRRKGGRGEREKSTWTQEVCHFPFTCQVIRWQCVFTPRRCRNQTHPAPFQITATDNKQLFTCWMRAGDETKVFCHCSKCASEQMHTSLKTPTSKRVPVNVFTFLSFHSCDLLDDSNLGHSYSKVNLIRCSGAFRNIFE